MNEFKQPEPPIRLIIKGTGPVPSFKNRKKIGKRRIYTDPEVKQRCQDLEDAIVSALYSQSRTGIAGTDSEWQNQLRTVLSGLSDDSLNEIPEFSFGVIYVQSESDQGVEIEIEALPQAS